MPEDHFLALESERRHFLRQHIVLAGGLPTAMQSALLVAQEIASTSLKPSLPVVTKEKPYGSRTA